MLFRSSFGMVSSVLPPSRIPLSLRLTECLPNHLGMIVAIRLVPHPFTPLPLFWTSENIASIWLFPSLPEKIPGPRLLLPAVSI